MPQEIACGQAPKGMGPVVAQPNEGGPINGAPAEGAGTAVPAQEGRSAVMTARVGRPAPDFSAEGFHQGAFKSFQLSEFKGHWVLLCFYPGDFTFV